MPDTTETPRDILKKYADTLMATAQAPTEDEKYEIADELIEIVGGIEARGEEVAQLIYKLLEENAEPVTE